MSQPGNTPAPIKRVKSPFRKGWFASILFLGLTLPLLMATWYSLTLQRSTLERAFSYEMANMIDVLANGMQDPIWNLIPEAGAPLIDTVMRDPRVIRIAVTSRAQNGFLHADRPQPTGSEPRTLRRAVVRDGDTIGEVALTIDFSKRTAIGMSARQRIALVGGIQLLLSFAVVLFVIRTARRLEISHFIQQANDDLHAEIADRKRTELALRQSEEGLRQSQKLEAVGQLTGGIAHDFNNLLAVIMGNAELLLDEDPQEQPPLIDAIIKASDRGANLTQRLLAFSRKQSLSPQIINLGDLVYGMSDMLNRTLGESIEVTISVDPNIWMTRADPSQVENVLLNLALNSRDAMSGRGVLRIECLNKCLNEADARQFPDATPGDYVALRVTDQGIGMSPEVKAHAFEPFFTTKEVGQGSGLGLSMIYGFAKQSGGDVKICTKEGQGTTVCFILPRTGGALGPKADIVQPKVPQGRNELILVIEDNPEVCSLTRGMLENLGYRVIAVSNTAAADEVLHRKTPVDLVVSDVILPGGESGPEFAKRMRAANPDFKVIFMSGYPAEAIKRNGLNSSEQALLHKPFQKRQLAQAVHDALMS